MKKLIAITLLITSSICLSQVGTYEFYGDYLEYPDSSTRFYMWRDGMPHKEVIRYHKNDSILFYGRIVSKKMTKTNWTPNNPTSIVYVDDYGKMFATHKDSLKVLWGNIQGAPNVGDVYTSGAYSNPPWLTSLAQSKITYSGSSGQYIKGDGALGKMPEKFTGTTNGSGQYSITFANSYSAAPNIQVAIQGDHPSYTAVVSSKSTTGCTIKVYTLSSILALGLVPQYSAVSGVVVDVIITEK